MIPKKKTFTGMATTALLTTALALPTGCSKQNNIEATVPESTVTIVETPPAPPPVQTRPQPDRPAPIPRPPRATSTEQQPAQQSAPTTQQQPAPTPPTVELPPGWTQEQYQTLITLRNEIRLPNVMRHDQQVQKIINGDLNDIDPILVGRHIVFEPTWLEFVGNNRQLSRQQFQAWRDRLDRVYDSYEELIGSKPVSRDKMLVSLRPASDFPKPAVSGMVNRNTPGIIRINRDVLLLPAPHNAGRVFFANAQTPNGVPFVLLHEMAHLFAFHREWELSEETAAEFLTAYSLESLGFHYGMPGFSHGPRVFGAFAPTRGTQHREHGFGMAERAFRNNTLAPISAGYGLHESVSAFYKFGLAGVNGVGWDAFKLAFRSYDDPNFVPRYQYRSAHSNNLHARAHEQARDLFDRVAQFSEIARRTNNPNEALRTLPDRGALLDQHLPVTKTPNTRTQAELQPARFRQLQQRQQHQQQLQQQVQQRLQQIQPTQQP